MRDYRTINLQILDSQPLPSLDFLQCHAFEHSFGAALGSHYAILRGFNVLSKQSGLRPYLSEGIYAYTDTAESRENEQKVRQGFGRKQTREVALRVIIGPVLLGIGCLVIYYNNWRGWWFWLWNSIGMVLIGSGLGAFLLPIYHDCRYNEDCRYKSQPLHDRNTVTHKYLLTRYNYCNTVIGMANVLNTDKRVAVIGALAEGSSIRSIERITGVHRDTIMRLGVRVGEGCAALLDAKMRDLPCRYLQFDEVWGFIGKKERHLRVGDDPQYGDVWTFCAIDAETKLVPTFKVGKRDTATAKAFVHDLAGRLMNRVQISSDALRAYVEAIEETFGADVDFGQIVKTYEHDYSQ
ncbi:MAG: hypothetical protein DMG96_40210, partial [Acidobacteria bacterium]